MLGCLFKRKTTNQFFDGVVKYWGLWLKPGDSNGMYNLAVEPCTVPYDMPIKVDLKKVPFIDRKATIEFMLKITFGEV